MRRSLATLLFLAAILQVGCREAPTYLKDTPEFPEAAGVTRLTYNLLDDRAPAFIPNAGALVYTASGYPPFPLRRGLLLNVARTGSSATLLLPEMQVIGDSTPWFTGPAFSPDGRRLAFVELTSVAHMPYLCSAGFQRRISATVTAPCPVSNSSAILRRGILRLVDAPSSQETGRLPLEFCCRTHAEHPGGELAELVTVTAHPFQQQFERDSVQLFRPSWSPDGTRLVYSDGLDLYLLNVASGVATVIPNTRDGVWPAWSPDGSRIAFTRLPRGPAQTATCECLLRTGGGPVPIGEWVITRHYDGGARSGTLTLIDPDGANARVLGEGEAPAWLPSGDQIIAQRENRLWRINTVDGAATAIAGTEGGFEPAVSRDGRSLAFSRRGSAGNHDVVVSNLQN